MVLNNVITLVIDVILIFNDQIFFYCVIIRQRTHMTGIFGTFDFFFGKDTLTNYFDSVYVITLPKRIEYVKETFKIMDIRYNHFSAILGSSLDTTDLIKRNVLSPKHKLKTVNEIACSLSHLAVISDFYKNASFESSTIMIFEDDIVQDSTHLEKIKKIMSNVPNDWEFLNFSRCWDSCYTQEKITETLVKSTRSLCGSAYALNKKGARKILELCFPIIDPIDVFFVALNNKKNVPLVMYSANPRVYLQMKSLAASKSSTSFTSNLTSSLGNNDTCNECSLNKNANIPQFTL
jgi:GR25 family glycosyltransferase involved in LPS biosynthesis